MDHEFVRIGYYVNNEYSEPHDPEHPPVPIEISKLYRNILADQPRVTRFAIDWTGGNGVAATGDAGAAGAGDGQLPADDDEGIDLNEMGAGEDEEDDGEEDDGEEDDAAEVDLNDEESEEGSFSGDDEGEEDGEGGEDDDVDEEGHVDLHEGEDSMDVETMQNLNKHAVGATSF